MPRYIVTSKAGPWVAGTRNNGVGSVLELSAMQAEHEMRLGSLVPAPEAPQTAIAPSPVAEIDASPVNPVTDAVLDVPAMEIAAEAGSAPAAAPAVKTAGPAKLRRRR